MATFYLKRGCLQSCTIYYIKDVSQEFFIFLYVPSLRSRLLFDRNKIHWIFSTFWQINKNNYRLVSVKSRRNFISTFLLQLFATSLMESVETPGAFTLYLSYVVQWKWKDTQCFIHLSEIIVALFCKNHGMLEWMEYNIL